jgi:hypothetical protein
MLTQFGEDDAEIVFFIDYFRFVGIRFIITVFLFESCTGVVLNAKEKREVISVMNACTVVAVTKLHASRSRKDFSAPYRAALSQQYSVASFSKVRVLSCLYSSGLRCSCYNGVRFCYDLQACNLVTATIVARLSQSTFRAFMNTDEWLLCSYVCLMLSGSWTFRFHTSRKIC